MTLRLAMLAAAVFLFASSPARAGTMPTTTDEARALVAAAPVAQATRPLASAVASTTDQARALAGGHQFLPDQRPAAAHLVATSTDEARAGTGVPLLQGEPKLEKTAACAGSCACRRG